MSCINSLKHDEKKMVRSLCDEHCGIIEFTHQSYLLNNPHNVGEFQGKFNGKQNLEVGLEARINSVFKMILTPLN